MWILFNMDKMFAWTKDGAGGFHSNPNSNPKKWELCVVLSIMNFTKAREESKHLKKYKMQKTSYLKSTLWKTKQFFYAFVFYKPHNGDYVHQNGKFKKKQNVAKLVWLSG